MCLGGNKQEWAASCDGEISFDGSRVGEGSKKLKEFLSDWLGFVCEVRKKKSYLLR